MIINRMTASFGKLDGETICFQPGLNVICAPNESGKSTWCAFIASMLYGVESSERSSANHLAVKEKYAPWSGKTMEGTMEITAGEKAITLTRTTKPGKAPMAEFSAVYTGTALPAEGLTGKNAGEILTGVTREVFRRSAFVEQGAAAITGGPDLEKRIQTILTSGEEGISYTEAEKRLSRWGNKRKHNKTGRIPELEAEIREKEQALSQIENSKQRLELLGRQLGVGQRLLREKEEQAQAEEQERRERLKSDLQVARAESLELAEKKSETEKVLKEAEQKKCSPAAFLSFLTAAFAMAVFWYFGIQTLWPILAAGVSALTGILLLIRYFRKKKQLREKIRDCRTAANQAAEEHAVSIEIANGLENALFLAPTPPSFNVERFAIERLKNGIAEENGRRAALGNEDSLDEELAILHEELAENLEEYEAIALARAALQQADKEIQSRFTPKLGEIAGGYMREMTGGKYGNILLNRSFSAMVQSGDDPIARTSDYLSAGTGDLLYLALRLAICDMALPEGDPCPLIIDDALVNLDEERFERAMHLLEKISEKRQVILFICRQ